MEVTGLEPVASGLQSRRSSQLSYTPTVVGRRAGIARGENDVVVGARGLEPRTSALSGRRSSRLSYAPTSSLTEYDVPHQEAKKGRPATPLE